jgi:tetratricopeptide (TPR) repeat protein
LALANKALDLYDGEAHFHALRGDVRLAADKYDMAITNYTRAIARREGFFYYHLQRGIANKEMHRIDSAVTDLNRSLELLPTAPAHFALGDIAEERGNYSEAIEHYKVVAESGGDYGKAAMVALVKLDLPTNPGAYIARACSADSAGKLVVTVRNDTTVTITAVQVAVTYTDASGRSMQQRHTIRGQIDPGKLASVNTGMGPYTSGGSCPVEVASARIADRT